MLDFEIDNMDTHFNKCARDYDKHSYNDLGMGEFYDEIERQINICEKPENVLVLGCGTGLEIERIKYAAEVTAIDISSGMLAELNKKELSPGVKLNTVCASYFDVSFTENNYDLVLSAYSLHHFTPQKKAQLYRKIYSCLKSGGYFINGDIVCKDKNTETYFLDQAQEIYEERQLPFGSLHIDVPMALNTELDLLSNAGFCSISVERRWSKSALIKAVK